MPCSDSSSGLNIRIDSEERLINFEFAKITCSREITGDTGFSAYCAGKTLDEILHLEFEQVSIDLKIKEDEPRFILYLEWDALRSGIAQYLGRTDILTDTDRCRISAVETDESGTEISFVILPPKELPKILPCSLAD